MATQADANAQLISASKSKVWGRTYSLKEKQCTKKELIVFALTEEKQHTKKDIEWKRTFFYFYLQFIVMVFSLIYLHLNAHEDRGGYLAKGSGKWIYV